jgi:glycine dehydrogenase
MLNAPFAHKHLGNPYTHAQQAMLTTIGFNSLEELVDKTVPENIRMQKDIELPNALTEAEYLQLAKEVSLKNKVATSFIGQGYYNCYTPSVILRNVFENPGWYTQYTPYQAEIAQGRLESLLNFQTMVSDLTALPVANASLLDEATAAAEAMTMFFSHANKGNTITKPKFFVDENTFAQTKELLKTRAYPLGIELVFDNYKTAIINEAYFGALVQYPNSLGSIEDYKNFIDTVHNQDGLVVMATDLLALTLITPPGELGADAAVGSAQRFGVPMGFGGPHAAFFATKDDFKRSIPGRIIGVSIDAEGNRALRMALQTREQHIKREKATSNICTAQALLANMAAMYAVYHGPEGLKDIAMHVQSCASIIASKLSAAGFTLLNENYFDTVSFSTTNLSTIKNNAANNGINLHYVNESIFSISVDETTTDEQLQNLFTTLGISSTQTEKNTQHTIASFAKRSSQFLTHPVFNSHHTETQMMRYIKYLENKDLSLNTSMISLGSCTMKLNAATQMMPLSWSHFANIHPFAPAEQTQGYLQMINELSEYLCKITAFDACSLQPNSGAQGEYAGLLAIKRYHEAQGNNHRKVMIIPISAHGTNPASAVMCGMQVVVVKALENGYIDIDDLRARVQEHSNNLAGIMITYPSTYGVYEETVVEITSLIHEHGGKVYMDGANMNAQVGLTAPGLIGADVCHLNLHKTFAIPHGGGGPGMGPICCTKELAPYLPGHYTTGDQSITYAVSAAPYGSASILLISYAYIRMLGAQGIKQATEHAILNANYMRARLQEHYSILYLGKNGTCAHEFIVDLRPFKKTAGIEAEDVAKRLMDYGFHAPTMSFPVVGTIMIEPTESEDKPELDRFCDAMIAIKNEIDEIEKNTDLHNSNLLKNAPHTMEAVISSSWTRPYTREEAVFPLPYVRAAKFWPSVARVNNTHGDRNLICTCEPVEAYMETN